MKGLLNDHPCSDGDPAVEVFDVLVQHITIGTDINFDFLFQPSVRARSLNSLNAYPLPFNKAFEKAF